MSRPLAFSCVLVSLSAACRPDPGIDIVRVPPSAYLAADAAVMVDAGLGDAAPEASVFMLCIEAPQPNDGKPDDDDDGEGTPEELHGKAPGDDDMSTDFPDCPNKYEGRNLDPRVTQRHRDKDDDKACCYRQAGSHPQPMRAGGSGE
jgi:hypothetical protein